MTQTCSGCQTGLDDEVKFCPECGHGTGQEVEAPVAWSPPVWSPPVSERPRPRIFGAVLGALIVWTILIMVLVFFVYVVASAPGV